MHAIRTRPALGWVRNEGLENQELLKRLATLQLRYDETVDELAVLRERDLPSAEAKKFQGLETEQLVSFSIDTDHTLYSVSIPLWKLFLSIADDMLVPAHESDLMNRVGQEVQDALASATHKQLSNAQPSTPIGKYVYVRDSSLADLLRQLLALALVEPEMVLRQSGDQRSTRTISQRCWVLTKFGRSKYLEKRARLASES